MSDIVSVVIPTYGGVEYLHRCIDSALNQTYKDIEVIVVDDNGIGTFNQIETYRQMQKYASNKRIKYICHEKNMNGSAARNTGVKNASGKYIALLDDDDVFNKDKIERQVKLLESLSDDYAFVYCSHEIYRDGEKVQTVHATHSGNLFYEKVSGRINIQTSGILIKKNIYIEVGGFDESFRRHQDWEFIERIMFKYKIMADDFIGYKRYLYGRSDAVNPLQSKERRLHYLYKMDPYFKTLTVKQYQEVIYYHRFDIAFRFLKRKNISGFIREIGEINPSLFGWKLLLRKILNIVNDKLLCLLKITNYSSKC